MRISATQLESYRLYLDPANEWATEANLIASIRGEVEPTPAMALGKAFHAILEDPDRYLVPGGYSCEGFAFDERSLAPLFERYDHRGVPEVKSTIELDGCTLVAQADLLAGTSVHEFKTTASYTFDPAKYAESVQWKVMSLIFRPSAIHYHVASVDDHGNSVVELRWVESLALYPYPELENDVRSLLASFKSYVTAKGLDEGLRQRARAAA